MSTEKTARRAVERPDVEPVSYTIEEAGWLYYGYGKAASYKAAQRGDLITVGSGKKWRRVPRAAMDRKFLEAGQAPAQKAITKLKGV
jgi:hypothetical protein